MHAVVYNYRIISSSITHSFKANILDINESIFRGWTEFFDKAGKGKQFENAYYACVLRRIEESINLYFVNPNNNKSKAILKQEYRNMLKGEPYFSAIQKVELNKIAKKQQVIAILGRSGFVSPIWTIYNRK